MTPPSSVPDAHTAVPPPLSHRRTVVVAIGGNALLGGGERATIEEQFTAAGRLALPLAELVRAGHRLVITHGNGPQVGFIKRRSDLVATLAPELPPLDLDMCVADSQGSLGYVLVSTLAGRLRQLGRPEPGVAAVLTHTVVDGDDPAFARPTKPIGSFYSQDVARALARQHAWQVGEDSGRGWRRLVASPPPRRILESQAVCALSQAGVTVVAGGGGGIPLVENPDGAYRGVEAVVDKDVTSALLADELGADLLVITTGVDRVAVDYGLPGQRFLDELDTDSAPSTAPATWRRPRRPSGGAGCPAGRHHRCARWTPGTPSHSTRCRTRASWRIRGAIRSPSSPGTESARPRYSATPASWQPRRSRATRPSTDRTW